MSTTNFSLTLILVLAAVATGAAAETTDAGLPHVLLIGDSISLGYTPGVRKLLQGKAVVARPTTPNGKGAVNCRDTTVGLAQLDAWLGETKWDVIHFNWGLHDLCYRHPEAKVYGHRDKTRGTISVPLEQYEKNLTKLVERLKATGATLIWASTTMVPEGEAGRFVGDEIKYNAVAAKIMAANNIAVDDLYAVTKAFPPELWKTPGDVHFAPAGYEKLAAQVAQSLERALAQRADG